MKLVFCIWKGINRSNKFIQSFNMDVVRRAQSDSKQQEKQKNNSNEPRHEID